MSRPVPAWKEAAEGLVGNRVIGMTRGGRAGLVCAITASALLVPYAASATANPKGAAISVANTSGSAKPASAGPPGTRFVSYNGMRVTVPESWPVIDLRLHPSTCVRLDQAALYLGSPGPQSDCPAHAVGRADTVWLRPLTTGRTDPLTFHNAKVGPLAARVELNAIGHDKQIQFVAQAVELEATWGADSSSIDQVVSSAVDSTGPSAPAPIASSSAAPTLGASAATAQQAPTSAQQISPAAGTSAVAAASTFTGMAFDTCAAPSASSMSAWLASPYRAVGVYIGGSMRACGDGNLSSTWVAQMRSMGWGLLPLYVGLQAPCVNQSGLGTISASQAAAQGAAGAADAVSRAKFFGLSSGAP